MTLVENFDLYPLETFDGILNTSVT